MKRFVEINNRTELIDSMDALLEKCHYKHKTGCLAPDCKECLDRWFREKYKYLLPTVDVAPVRHGRWVLISDDDQYEGDYLCSECKTKEFFSDESLLSNYCPTCGAKMDADQKKEKNDGD